MKTIEYRDEVAREGWGRGPWDGEPDRIQWPTAAGLPGLAVRHNPAGHWCGYVGVPEGHPLHGIAYDDARLGYEGPHGGLTYSEGCAERVCHELEQGEADDVWWFGFDCAHTGDMSPGYALVVASVLNRLDSAWNRREEYKTLAYVRAEVEKLAAALAAVEP